LLITTDFGQYKDVTPNGGIVPGGVGMFTRASCAAPGDFWVVVGDAGGSKGWLLHSTDSGASWHVASQLWNGSAGLGLIRFIDPRDGWLVAGDPGSNTVTFSSTHDGGVTWAPLSSPSLPIAAVQSMLPAFADPKIGFFASSAIALSGTPPSVSAVIRSQLLTTADGGVAWGPVTLNWPSPGTPFYDQPTFYGSRGVLPVLIISGIKAGTRQPSLPTASADVSVEMTNDGGFKWTRSTTLHLDTPVQLGIGTSVAGAPAVSPVDPQASWVTAVSQDGHIHVYRTSDGGNSWQQQNGEGLPIVARSADLRGGATQLIELSGITRRVAFASVMNEPSSTGMPVTYLTVDGGTHWSLFTAA
jgi:photosystem II stability/assembly factor-like uncharacterized protein